MSRVRTRLTLLYGLLFTAAGAALLTILYLLVRSSPKSKFLISVRGPAPALPDDPSGRAAAMMASADRQHAQELHNLLTQSATALAVMVVLSLALGWLVAGRILRPLRTMTAAIRRISARNVHDRLAVTGPRDELKDLADTVDGLLGRLAAALDTQKRFVANAAHELRTPLTLEHALIEETLTDPAAGVSDFRATCERLLDLGEQQARMLEALLALAGSERGLDRREPVDLAAVAGRTADAYRSHARSRGVDLQTSFAAAPTTGDEALAERLVANLIDNALAYNVAGGTVRVTTTTDDGRAVLCVVNTGPIVDPAGVDRLFEPFERLDRAARRDGHHGLGLSIVRAVAAAHDAELHAAANPHGGLTITVSFTAEGRAFTEDARPSLSGAGAGT